MKYDAVVLEHTLLALLLLLLVIVGVPIRDVLLVHSVVIKWYHRKSGLRLVNLVVLDRCMWIVSVNDTFKVLVKFLLPLAPIFIILFRS